MARLESVALGGYFKTPTHLLPRIAPILSSFMGGAGEVAFMDPCAGDGEAIISLMRLLVKDLTGHRAILYACEMEASRAKALKQSTGAISYHLGTNVVHGDAFRLTFEKDSKDGVSVLYLNPPYDLDRVFGRLENKFLTRFAPTLMEGGVLLFVVPYYALKASAEYLAKEFKDICCFKFPDEDFKIYKQVVLAARKGPTLLAPEPVLVEKVMAWAEDATHLPELPNITSEPVYETPVARQHYGGLKNWTIQPIDINGLRSKIRPWVQTTRNGSATPVHGILTDLPIQDLLLRTYPVATPPRPAHIAVGIASGIFNGSRVEPSDPSTGLPPLLVKGVFDKEYRTVEEKKDKHGEVKAVVQIQQPKLVTTILDMRTHRYHTLGSGDASTPEVEKLTVAGLLKYYGDSLMAVMEKQCPIIYDPRRDSDSITLTSTQRSLFTAQKHASKAIVKLLGGNKAKPKERHGRTAILLGEIGSGKSTVALTAARTIGSKRPLVLCPPHLLTSWRNEVAAVFPEAEVRVLSSIPDIEAIDADTSDRMIVSVLSRETAKLSHGWVGVGDHCPKCGGDTPKVDLAKKRSRCENSVRFAYGPVAQLVMKMANQLVRYVPRDGTISTLLSGRWDRRRIAHYKAQREKGPIDFPGFASGYFDVVLPELLKLYSGHREQVERALVWILLATGDQSRTVELAKYFLGQTGYQENEFGRYLLLMLPPNSPEQLEVVQEQKSKQQTYAYSSYNSWTYFPQTVESAQKGESHVTIGGVQLSWATGALVLDKEHTVGCLDAAQNALRSLSYLASFKWTQKCNEFLYQAVPEPRRVALAKHIMRRHPNTFDFLVLDEGHEYATDGSAQERAAHRLTSLGLPTLLMTGTIMNGYAESMFTNMWALSASFRQEFKRADRARFVDRYGYRKRIVQEQDELGEIVSFGSQSDRITRSERVVGNAPGVLPLFLLKHLLPLAVTLHKADLAIDLPPCKQERNLIEPDPVQKSRLEELQRCLVAKIKKDQFDEELAGKLFGQLAELPSYLDRCTSDTGNTDHGWYEIRYPESVGGSLVKAQEPFLDSTIQPKEQWILDTVERELSEGRKVMVFSWHVNLLPRLSRLISTRLGGERVPILYADKVPTAKRQDWIDREVVRKGARVMITNPVAIQTGLNNLVHFCTEIWHENPACNPIVYRQAVGRVDRIGQTLETRIYFPVYSGTLQVQLYDLLLKKVAVSISTDGLDPESALLAAGVGEDEYLTGLSIGKQLWDMLTSGVEREERGIVYRPARAVSRDAVALLAMLDE